MSETLLTTAYLPPVQYFAALYHAERVVIEKYDHYMKQTYRNRCIIAGANGALTLSIPIIKPATPKTFSRDIEISDHGNWQHLHWHAIISAYNSSPFFEYYADDFAPFYRKNFQFLFDFNEQLRSLVCRLLEIEPSVTFSAEYITAVNSDTDFRETIHPKKETTKADLPFIAKEYYQVFRQKHGFFPNLSIIDLLFNMGPEARLILQASHKNK